MKLRIVELSTDRLPSPPQKGGAIEKYVFQISKELTRLSDEVHLISIDDGFGIEVLDGVIRHFYDGYSFNIIERSVGEILSKLSSPLNRKLLYTTRSVLAILLSIREIYGDIDTIHNHYFTTSFAPLIYNFLNRGVLLATHYHNVPKENSINKLLAKYYDLHFTVSRYVKRKVIERLGVPKERVFVVYNAIDVREFSCTDRGEVEERERYGLKEDDIVLLYVGRITPEKGLHHLLMAFKYVLNRFHQHDLKLLIAGPIGQFDLSTSSDAAYYHFVVKLANKLNIAGKIIYLGYADVKALYRVADLVVVPSIWQDPCPTVVMESLASCKPVVAYPTGGIPEIISGLPYNFLSESVNPEALAERIIEVLSSTHRIEYKLLRRHVEERFSSTVVANSLKRIFEEHVK